MTQAASAPPAPSRRDRTRERLMDAAFDIFAEEGYAAASVEAITERAGFSRGAFYYNFASKEELLLALVEWSVERRLGTVDESRAIANFFDGLDDDARLLDLMRDQNEADDLKWAMVVTEFRLHAVRGSDPTVGAKLDALFRRVVEGLAVRLGDRAGAAGAEFTVPVDMVATLAIGTYMQAVVDAAVAHLARAQAEQLTAERLTAVLRGLIRRT